MLVGHSQAQSRLAGASPCLARTIAEDPSTSVLVFRPNGQIVRKGESKEPEADVAEMPNRLPENQDGWLSLQLVAFGEGEVVDPLVGAVQLGVEDAEGKLTYFTISPEEETHYTYKDNQQAGAFKADFRTGDLLRVERKGDQLSLLLNDKTAPIATISKVTTSVVRFRIRLVRRGATIAPQYATYSTGSCPPFAVLKHRLDASYLQQTDDVLRFEFQQRYGTPNNSPQAISYVIYDWQRNAAQSGTFDVQYGINWSEIRLNNLANNTFYTLEINANKDEQYLLRFKTKQP